MTRVPWRQAMLWLLVLAAVTLAMLAIRSRLDKAHVALVFLLVVLGASAAGGRLIGFATAGGAFLAFNYLFLPPYYTLVIADPLDWLVLVTFLVTGVVATQLLATARMRTELAVARAREVDRLATLGAETLAAPNAVAGLQSIASMIREALEAECVELYRLDAGVLQRMTRASAAGEGRDDARPELTTWYGDSARAAVLLPDGTTRLDPGVLTGLELTAVSRTLEVKGQSVGVLRVIFAATRLLDADQARLLEAFAYYAALGVERVRLEVTAERAEAERRVEALRSALLMAVSHDLRTPLTTIKALAHEIHGQHGASAARIIEDEADRLDHLVGNLLELSRIQAGAVPPATAVNTIDELIGTALQRAHGALAGHTVAVSLPDELLVARFDFAETVRIVVNLLENAAKYSPAGQCIELSGHRDGASVVVEVADQGPGVPDAEVERIFESFYRPAQTPPDVRGSGLGLSIARGLAEAQGGTVTYRPRAGGGAVFALTLPVGRAPEAPEAPA